MTKWMRYGRTAMATLVVAGLGGAVGAAPASAQEPGSVVARDNRVQGRSYTFPGTGKEVPYALFVPSNYDAAREWPLIVALHGLGRPYDWMMGYDGNIDAAERDGYIMVAPLGYHARAWYGSRGPGVPNMRRAEGDTETLPENLGELSEQDVMNVFELVRQEFNIDENRMYLWGHSMGGAGTYHLAEQHPNLWAAVGVAAPAPSVDPSQLEAFKHVPIIVLQGDEDPLVTRTREWVAKMKTIGMEHVYIEVKGGDHSRFINSSTDTIEKIFAFFNIVRKDQRPQTN
ncbi:MAG: prolyl oligopeptidase family serine peptidase [bacterium]|nr:poly(3-hydroxybutyrate) depolymerase [Gemmatimonadota bacterium]